VNRRQTAEEVRPFPCWCGFFTADYICDEHDMTLTRAELLLKIQELESIIWDGTRQVAELEAALEQASERCARPRGVCFPAQDLGDGRVRQAGGLGDGS
jgi:hypothetical protein